MEIILKINPKQNTAYIRDEVRESLGYEWNFNLDNGVGIVYPVNMDIIEAIRRVKLNLRGLELNKKPRDEPAVFPGILHEQEEATKEDKELD